MSYRKSSCALVAGLAMAIPAFGQAGTQPEKKDDKKPAVAPADKAKQGDQPAEMDAMMQAWMEANKVGENHRLLDFQVGRWEAKSKFFSPDPNAPATEGTATETNTWVLDGRYLRSNYDCPDFMGMPFKGIGFTGYDNSRKQYVSIWMDSMSTGIMQTYGTYDAATKTFTYTGEADDPMSGGKYKMRQVLKVVDNDHHTFEMYRETNGQQFKEGEIQYTRLPGGGRADDLEGVSRPQGKDKGK